jgi:hypothetical protein
MPVIGRAAAAHVAAGSGARVAARAPSTPATATAAATAPPRTRRRRRTAGFARQRRQDLVHRREPRRRVGRQAAGRDRPQPGRQAVEGRGLPTLGAAGLDRGRGEGPPTGDRLDQGHGEGELIAGRRRGAAVEQLGRQVRRRADHQPGLGHRRLVGLAGRRAGAVGGTGGTSGAGRDLDRARQAEVGDVGLAVAIDQHVVGLEVAVDQAGAMRRRQAAPGRRQHPDDRRRRPRRRRQPRPERAAVDQRHRDRELAVVLLDVVDRDDVGVAQLGQGPGLAHQARALASADPIGPHQLERDLALELPVDGAVNHRHAAAAELAQELVARGFAADR